MRYSALDAVRGIAAFAVVIHHCVLAGLIAIPAGAWTTAVRYTPLYLFVSGRPPVILFFVLSGFVLSVALEGARGGGGAGGPMEVGCSSWATFAARRFCRIYVPFATMVLISAAACLASPDFAAPAGSWVSRLWSDGAGGPVILRHLSMPVLGLDLSLDRVAWSLVHEIRISLLFPLLWLCAWRMPWALLAGSAVLFGAGREWSGCANLACLPYNGADTVESFGATGYFVLFFVFGSLLARWRAAVEASLRALGAPARALLWALAVYGMIVPFKFAVLPDLAVGLSATLLLALVLSGGIVRRGLVVPPFAWLGRVSFSLYLCHLIVLAVAVRIGGNAAPIWVLAGTLAGSLAAAELMFRMVEQPSMWLGRQVTPAFQFGRVPPPVRRASPDRRPAAL